MSASPCNQNHSYSVYPAIIDRKRCGLSQLSHEEQRQRLAEDMQQWLDTGHCVTPLPYTVKDPTSRIVRVDLFEHIIGYHHD